jgi:predicted  nucleic acid-binding Zn-ribbon protein
VEATLQDALVALQEKDAENCALLEEQRRLRAEVQRMSALLGKTQETCLTAEGQVSADREVKAFLDKQLMETEAELKEARRSNESLEVQLGLAGSMKEYLAHQWQESARQVVELETTIAAVTEQQRGQARRSGDLLHTSQIISPQSSRN